MTVNYTTLLALAQPVTGTESGTWGDYTNNGLSSYLDAAISGTQTLSSDADTTLALTQGTNTATNLGSTSAQYLILNCTGARTTTRTITVPASSREYIVINATTGGYAINVVGAGPTSGISVANGERCVIAWNGSDYVKIASNAAANITVGTLATANGGTALSSFTSGGAVYATSTSALTTGTLPIASGGTAATTASAARTSLGLAIGTDVPSPTGTGASGTWGIGISGTAATATTVSAASVSSGTYWQGIWGATGNVTSMTTLTKVISLRVYCSGTVNVYWGLSLTNNGYVGTASGRVYVDGVAAGTTRTTSSGTYVYYTDSVSVSAGSLVQIYISESANANTANAIGMQIGTSTAPKFNLTSGTPWVIGAAYNE